MTRTIFRSSFLLGILVLLLCALLFYTLQVSSTLEETYEALRQEAIFAEQGLMLDGISYLKSLEQINRLTWISGDGEVLYDSEYDLPIANQLKGAEVLNAVQKGEGRAIRRSQISGEETIYLAILCEDGTILRLSRALSATRYALIFVSPVLWVLILVLMISALFSFYTSKKIVEPINELSLDDPDSCPYPELRPLVNRIQEQKETIRGQGLEQEHMRKEFSANVSHELKTPLTSISGFAELMASEDLPPEVIKEFSSDIFQETQRMIVLVDDIIKLSRLDEGVTLDTEEVDLYALASDTLDSLRSIAQKREITLRQTGETAVVIGVWQLLSEMLYNLCDNAIKYNQPGGSVTVDVQNTPGGVLCSVSDTGIGIPAEHQDRVFERFYRVDKSHSKSIGGTGLGLSIVKHAAQQHHASISMDSIPGEGTRISILFPPAQKEEKTLAMTNGS